MDEGLLLAGLLVAARDLNGQREASAEYVRGQADLICQYLGLRPAGVFRAIVTDAITGRLPVQEAVTAISVRLEALRDGNG